MKRLLSISNLKTYFYTSLGIVNAVDDVSFEINEKEAVGLIGESGCGKTMTALSIVGLLPRPGKIAGGKIKFKGKNLLELTNKEMRSFRGNQISMIFQNPQAFLNPVMKVGDQIAEILLEHKNLNKNEAKSRSIELLDMLDISLPSKVVNYYPHQLSGGMCQRVLIAIAFACKPSLLIADEPTSALDATIQIQVLKIIKELIKDFGTSLLLITHDLGIMADICDRVYVMYAGKIVENADTFTFFEKPKHPYSMGLLKSVTSVTNGEDPLFGIEGVVPILINPPKGCRFHPRCPNALKVCFEKEPPPIEIEPGHKTSCWLYN